MPVLLEAILAALLIAANQAGAVAGVGMKKSTATKLCSISEAAKTSAADLAARLATIRLSLKDAQKAAKQQDVIAATRANLTTPAKVLRYYANSASKEASDALNDWTGDNTKLIGHAMYTAGRIDELMLLFQNSQNDNSGGQDSCLAEDNGNHPGNKQAAQACNTEDITTIEAKPTDLATKVTQELAGVSSIHAGAGTECHLTASLSAKYSTYAAPMQLIGGLITIPAGGDLTPGNDLATKRGTVALFKKLKEHGSALKTKLTPAINQAPTDYNGLKKLLKTKAERKKLGPAAKAALHWAEPKRDEELDSELKKIFGISDDETDGAYITSLADFNLKVHTTPTETDNINLFNLNDDQLSEALSDALEQNRQQAASKPCTAKESKDKPQNTDSDTCASKGPGDNCKDGCKLERTGDNKKCVKDPDYKPPQAEEAKPGVNCSSHTTKETCEAVTGTAPPGKKSVCGWIEDKCKDFSFLLNKHFALSMVSAAFVALLF
uniref:Variant surface glycoprotein 1125.282 n=1 Tax=Trypanosoma brucei TaxID=5691 RepID=A0A1J0R5I1_9TRYP|nr:variant surface glycoprotein 1125.282 [Trypanosoma brucei]